MSHKKSTKPNVQHRPLIQEKIQEVLSGLQSNDGEKSNDDNNPLTLEEQVLVLQNVLFTVGNEAGISQPKLTNGTLGESIACRYLDLTWNKDKIHGCDAFNSQGEQCELKTAHFVKRVGLMININYKLPTRKVRESGADYTDRIVEKMKQDVTGGHYWVLYKGTEVKKYWHINGDNLATYVGMKVKGLLDKKPSRKDFHLNFGGTLCRDCWQTVHRTEVLCEKINLGLYSEIPDRTPGRCGLKG